MKEKTTPGTSYLDCSAQVGFLWPQDASQWFFLLVTEELLEDLKTKSEVYKYQSLNTAVESTWQTFNSRFSNRLLLDLLPTLALLLL